MSKYDQVWKYVQKAACPTLQLTFDQIRQIAGVPIDHSFLRYKKECLEYGCQVHKISMKEQTVVFHQIDAFVDES